MRDHVRDVGALPRDVAATLDRVVSHERRRLAVLRAERSAADHRGVRDRELHDATDSRGQENRYTTCPVGVCSQTIPGAPNSIYVVPIVPLTVGLKVSQNF